MEGVVRTKAVPKAKAKLGIRVEEAVEIQKTLMIDRRFWVGC